LVSQLSECGTCELELLCGAICAIEQLRGGEEVGDECVVAVTQLLEQLERCRDPMTVSCRQLASSIETDRLRGLGALSALRREVLPEAVASEVSAAELVAGLLAVEGSIAEQISAWRSLFALCLRNGPEASVSVLTSDALLKASTTEHNPGAGGVVDAEGVILAALQLFSVSPFSFGWEMIYKCSPGPVHDSYLKAWSIYWNRVTSESFLNFTVERMRTILPLAVEQMLASDDLLISSSLVSFCCLPCSFSSHPVFTGLVLHNVELMDSMLAVWHRISPTTPSAEWWVQRAVLLNYEVCCLLCIYTGMANLVRSLQMHAVPLPPTVEPRWREILGQAANLVKINQAAQLSRTDKMPVAILSAARIVFELSLEPSLREGLLSSGVVPALLWASANEFVRGAAQLSLASYAAGAAANLIGRNEEGLTLSADAIGAVLSSWLLFFARTGRRATYPVNRMLADAQAVANVSISDANKAFIVECEGLFDG
jgi:hypothetical protein